MDVQPILAWVAPAATMIAALMTASNLGARFTGWGFVMFTLGSVSWSAVALASDQQNLLWTNAFLTFVNLIGIWRWLGRQARYDDGGTAAMERSAAIAGLPELVAVGAVPGTRLVGRDGDQIGVVVEAMMRCADLRLAYIVVSEGGLGGVGERLHALPPHLVTLSKDQAICELTAEELAERPTLQAQWPARLPSGAERVQSDRACK